MMSEGFTSGVGKVEEIDIMALDEDFTDEVVEGADIFAGEMGAEDFTAKVVEGADIFAGEMGAEDTLTS